MEQTLEAEVGVEVDENLGLIEVNIDGSVVFSSRYSEDEGIIFLDDSEVVDPRLRGQGLGREAVKKIIKYFKQKGYRGIELKAAQGREDGPYDTKTPFNFWVNSCGFKSIGNGRVQLNLA